MRARNNLPRIVLVIGLLLLPAVASAAGVPIAIFPLQELGEGRQDVNLPLTRDIAERLAESGNEILTLESVIAFMSNYRIRTLGHLETLNITRARRELGAAFVLLGTVSQRKEKPQPVVGLTLNLLRTSDARTVWSYVGSFSTGEERRVLGIGEPKSTAELQSLLLEEVAREWPRRRINGEQQTGSLNIESTVLEPRQVRPGDDVHCRVRLHDLWSGAQMPRVFFQVGDQLYPAVSTVDGSTYEATWVAGEQNGHFQVSLLREWPQYGRREMALLGSYHVDGTPPLLELAFRGTTLHDGTPVFDRRLVIFPRMLVGEPLDRWKLSFYFEDGDLVGDMTGAGNLPGSFIWNGRGNQGDGIYRVEVTAWDKAGNSGTASRDVELIQSTPQVDLALDRKGENATVDLDYEGKVPLKYWRLEMWTREGRIITQSDGKELPASIDIDLPDHEQGIQGYLVYQDELGKKVKRDLEEVFASLMTRKEEVKEPTGISESWVDEF